MQITFVKDEGIRQGDVYKSHVVYVPSGEPPTSLCHAVPKRKTAVAALRKAEEAQRPNGGVKVSVSNKPA